MTPERLVARIERMVAVASVRVADADQLEESPRSTSDSGYLLRLLAFEILLKAVVRINGVAPRKSHSYSSLFHLLPETVRERVVARAIQRMTTSADYSSLPVLLDTFSSNFTILRYPYEAYESVSAEALKGAGRGWVARGAPDSEAVFVYHPEELFGLTFALTTEVQDWLNASR